VGIGKREIGRGHSRITVAFASSFRWRYGMNASPFFPPFIENTRTKSFFFGGRKLKFNFLQQKNECLPTQLEEQWKELTGPNEFVMWCCAYFSAFNIVGISEFILRYL